MVMKLLEPTGEFVQDTANCFNTEKTCNKSKNKEFSFLEFHHAHLAQSWFLFLDQLCKNVSLYCKADEAKRTFHNGPSKPLFPPSRLCVHVAFGVR